MRCYRKHLLVGTMQDRVKHIQETMPLIPDKALLKTYIVDDKTLKDTLSIYYTDFAGEYLIEYGNKHSMSLSACVLYCYLIINGIPIPLILTPHLIVKDDVSDIKMAVIENMSNNSIFNFKKDVRKLLDTFGHLPFDELDGFDYCDVKALYKDFNLLDLYHASNLRDTVENIKEINKAIYHIEKLANVMSNKLVSAHDNLTQTQEKFKKHLTPLFNPNIIHLVHS